MRAFYTTLKMVILPFLSLCALLISPACCFNTAAKAKFVAQSRQQLKTAIDNCRIQSQRAAKGNARTFFITGATDGIGRHTALKLACDGHRVFVHGRKSPDSSVVKNLLGEIHSRGAHSTSYFQADFLDLREVAQLAAAVKKEIDKIDVLINNAGVFRPYKKANAQGYDATWAVNVLAPFKLTMLLLPLVAKGSNPRIIITSSPAQSATLPADINSIGVAEGQHSDPYVAYSLSKLGDRLFTVGLADRLRVSRDPKLSAIKCLTMDPGTVNTKMLLSGWGKCGIPISEADNTYKLAALDVDHLESGSYSFGGAGSADATRPDKVNMLWRLLEKQTGIVYSREEMGG